MENEQVSDWLESLPELAENIHFKPEEMISCAHCNRTNPPNRAKCFYCGAELEISDAHSQFFKLSSRKLEIWEKGFNLIFKSANENVESNLSETSRFLKVELEYLQKFFETKNSLPLVRVESEKEAQMVQIRLCDMGVETVIVGDAELATDKPPRRLRGIEFFGDALVLLLFNQDETIQILADDLALIVTGAIIERKISATEQFNKKGENKILDSTEMANDELLIDLYSRDDSQGFRIYAKGFDFSSLETEKAILAKDNIRKLAGKIQKIAPNVKTINNYLVSRNLLANIWEVEQKVDSQGLKREGFGKFNLANVTTVNNISQFTKYSRLQWHLL